MKKKLNKAAELYNRSRAITSAKAANEDAESGNAGDVGRSVRERAFRDDEEESNAAWDYATDMDARTATKEQIKNEQNKKVNKKK